MYNFKIHPSKSWYTHPQWNNRVEGHFISQQIDAFYHSPYIPGDNGLRETKGTVENIITTLKNQFLDKQTDTLRQAQISLLEILSKDLPKILQQTKKNNLIVCTVPRARALHNYLPNQLFFKEAVSMAVKKSSNFKDGTDYLIRHTDTRTTHLDKSGYGGDGPLPYPGITKKTCTISEKVRGADILLIDDLYTEYVNIDEDVIQALFDNKASSVVFYSLGKTERRNFVFL